MNKCDDVICSSGKLQTGLSLAQGQTRLARLLCHKLTVNDYRAYCLDLIQMCRHILMKSVHYWQFASLITAAAHTSPLHEARFQAR